ncbi:hypothetical protein AaE_013112, partial [Aphanomyces astaci]
QWCDDAVGEVVGEVQVYRRNRRPAAATSVFIPRVLVHGAVGLYGVCEGGEVEFSRLVYLISGILFKENAKGSLTYADFYSRRIHRMFPALLLVLTFTLVVGCVWLLDKAV